MSKFTLRKLTNTVYEVKLGRDKIGHCTQYGSRYTCVITHKNGKRIEKTANSANEAFSDVVRAYNRITLCGEDNEDKARNALHERNQAVRDEANQWNSWLSETANRLNMQSPVTMKVTNRKIKI